MTDLDDDYIIELTDIADKNSDISTDDVIELTDIAEDENISLDLDIEKEDEFNIEISDTEDFSQADVKDDEFEKDSYDVELEEVDPADDELQHDIIEMAVEEPETGESETENDFNKAAIQDLNIDQEQIESVLERVIEKKFSDKIENILFEVMKNVIEKQIIEIKESLQKDLEQIDNN